MGWWSMGMGGGGIDAAEQEMVMGDGPADKMGAGVTKVIAEYERDWHRKPTVRELRGCFEFVLGGLEDELQP